MKKIYLSQNRFALVDDLDYGQLSQFKWCVCKGCNTFYAMRSANICGKRTTIQMHREILGLSHKDGKHTDHIDGNGLNNSRSNLRICTNQQNSFNRKSSRGSSSVFKGVNWYKRNRKWMAYIRHKNRRIHIGYFINEIDAANAYNRAAQKHFGEYAKLNNLGQR